MSAKFKAFDRLMEALGLTKVFEGDYTLLNREVTEKCSETSGYGGCIAEVSGEFTVAEFAFPLITAIGVWMEYGWLWYIDPLAPGFASCLIEIEIVGEGDNYSVPLKRIYYDRCVV
jgi:hypothetical protein